MSVKIELPKYNGQNASVWLDSLEIFLESKDLGHYITSPTSTVSTPASATSGGCSTVTRTTTSGIPPAPGTAAAPVAAAVANVVAANAAPAAPTVPQRTAAGERDCRSALLLHMESAQMHQYRDKQAYPTAQSIWAAIAGALRSQSSANVFNTLRMFSPEAQ